VRVGFQHHYHDSSTVSPMFSTAKQNNVLALNEWNGKFCTALHRENTDAEVIKHRVSAFYGTDLDLILRANRIEHLILTGVSTSMAVEATAREAHDRDFSVTVIEDATECASDEEKKASLNILSRIANCITTAEKI
jgi:nicotinamidase-related amidase